MNYLQRWPLLKSNDTKNKEKHILTRLADIRVNHHAGISIFLFFITMMEMQLLLIP